MSFLTIVLLKAHGATQLQYDRWSWKYVINKEVCSCITPFIYQFLSLFVYYVLKQEIKNAKNDRENEKNYQ